MIPVSQVMTGNPVTVHGNDPIRKAFDLMIEGQFRRLPVTEGGDLVGIVTDRDLRRATNSPLVLHETWYDEYLLDHITVKACMTPDPITVTSQTPVEVAASIMCERQIGGVPVVDEDKLVGIITRTDLLKFLVKLLKETYSSLSPLK
jgi:acetoin utilization protein AcuB